MATVRTSAKYTHVRGTICVRRCVFSVSEGSLRFYQTERTPKVGGYLKEPNPLPQLFVVHTTHKHKHHQHTNTCTCASTYIYKSYRGRREIQKRHCTISINLLTLLAFPTLVRAWCHETTLKDEFAESQIRYSLTSCDLLCRHQAGPKKNQGRAMSTQ